MRINNNFIEEQSLLAITYVCTLSYHMHEQSTHNYRSQRKLRPCFQVYN